MSPCCSLNLYSSLHLDTAHQMTLSSHEDMTSAQIRKLKGSMNQSIRLLPNGTISMHGDGGATVHRARSIIPQPPF